LVNHGIVINVYVNVLHLLVAVFFQNNGMWIHVLANVLIDIMSNAHLDITIKLANVAIALFASSLINKFLTINFL
jgi:hypothetical protein